MQRVRFTTTVFLLAFAPFMGIDALCSATGYQNNDSRLGDDILREVRGTLPDYEAEEATYLCCGNTAGALCFCVPVNQGKVCTVCDPGGPQIESGIAAEGFDSNIQPSGTTPSCNFDMLQGKCSNLTCKDPVYIGAYFYGTYAGYTDEPS
jgi:hypothetical protein